MQEFQWGSDFSNPQPGATNNQIEAVEARLGVRFPEVLREGLKSTSMASVFKRGKYCDSGVTAPFAKGGRILGWLPSLERLDRIEIETKYIAEYVDDLYERPFPDVIPFAHLPAGGWTCLNYQNDPTRANPEIWEGNMETNATFETFFHKIADSFDDFIDMLLPDDEIAALGFRV
jgi:SMI1 / KNR4 family (SUKH-1)